MKKLIASTIASISLLAATAGFADAPARHGATGQKRHSDRDASGVPETNVAAPGAAIAQADQRFDRVLTLPESTLAPDEDQPDSDEPSPPRLPPPPQPPRDEGRQGGGHETAHGAGRPSGGSLPLADTFDPFKKTKIKLGNDPQVAVGEHYIVGTEAHTIVFYDKKTGKELPPSPTQSLALAKNCGNKEAGMCMTEFFAPFLAPFLNDSSGKADPSRPNPQDVNRHLGKPVLSIGPVELPALETLVCDADNPTAAGCIDEAYDTRVLYDDEHKRFWVQAHLRNKLYGSGDESKNHINVPSWTNLQRRFVAVAVSITENPQDGFHEFLLFEHPGDWPTMAVHGRFLVVGSKGRKNVHLFDAQKLRNGNENNGLLSLGSYSGSEFDSDEIWPVVQHDKRHSKPFIPAIPGSAGGTGDVPTFLVGIGGSKVRIYAFDKPSLLIDQPGTGIMSPTLMSASVNLHHDFDDVRTNPIYRNGFIYVTGQECVTGDGPSCNHEVRVIRIPVFRANLFGNKQIFATADRSMGFQDFVFGGDDPSFNVLTSYELPAIEVNKNDDVVVVYGRADNPFGATRPPGAYYAISYHDNRGLLADGVLAQEDCKGIDAIACLKPGPEASHLDLPGIAIDPADDTTVWMAHGFVDPQILKYRMVIGRVKP